MWKTADYMLFYLLMRKIWCSKVSCQYNRRSVPLFKCGAFRSLPHSYCCQRKHKILLLAGAHDRSGCKMCRYYFARTRCVWSKENSSSMKLLIIAGAHNSRWRFLMISPTLSNSQQNTLELTNWTNNTRTKKENRYRWIRRWMLPLASTLQRKKWSCCHLALTNEN